MNRFSNIGSHGNLISDQRQDFNFRPTASRLENFKKPVYNNRTFDNKKELQVPINFQEQSIKEQNLKNNSHFKREGQGPSLFHFNYLFETPKIDNTAHNSDFFDYRATATR